MSNDSSEQKPTPTTNGGGIVAAARAVTRPIITIIFAGVIAQIVIEGINAPQWFLALAGGCIVWWFGDRTVTHITDRISSK